jgi:hypothetical protein
MQAAEFTRETDCLLEEDGFKPSVPLPEESVFGETWKCYTSGRGVFESVVDLTGYRGFESGSLRQPVCLTSEPPGSIGRTPRFSRRSPVEWDVRGGRRGTTGPFFRGSFSLSSFSLTGR